MKLNVFLKEKLNRLNQHLYKSKYHLSRIDHVNLFEPLLYLIIKKTNDFSFIQIGANDGKSFDPVYQFVTHNHNRLKGIVIEPMKDTFKQLEHNYQKFHNIITINAAIHNSDKEMVLYKANPKRLRELPEWTKGMASFNKEHFANHNIPEDYLITEQVQCISFE